MLASQISTLSLWSDREIVAKFLDAKGMRSQHTRASYQRDIQKFQDFLRIEYGWDDQDSWHQVDVLHVTAYHAQLVDAVLSGELSERTVNRRIASLSSFFKWCFKPANRKLTGVQSNPVDVDRYRVESSLAERVLTEGQILDLLELTANPPNRRFRYPQRNSALCRFLYSSGCRVSEVTILKWKHCSVTKDGAIVQITGKRGKRRYVRISQNTLNSLMAMDTPQGKDDFVFCNPKNGKAMTRSGLTKLVQRCGKLIGVENLTPHVFRHSHATHAVRRGVPLDLVRDTLGHSSIATTQIYLKANPTDSSGLHLMT